MNRKIEKSETGSDSGRRARIMIADEDDSYIVPLHIFIAKEMKETAFVEAVTRQEYLDTYFSVSQSLEILIISEELFRTELLAQDIRRIYILTTTPQGREQNPQRRESDPQRREKDPLYREQEPANVSRIWKYSNIETIFREIVKGAGLDVQIAGFKEPGCRIVTVYSPRGGTGKTTIALGIAYVLSEKKNRVLYIDAEGLQIFPRYLKNAEGEAADSDKTGSGPSGKNTAGPYDPMQPIVLKEGFFFLPPFQTSLVSLGLDVRIFEELAQQAKKAQNYDFIIMDTDSSFDAAKIRLLEQSDQVLLIITPTADSAAAAAKLLESIDISGSDKYLLVCNRNDPGSGSKRGEETLSAFPAAISGYIETIEGIDRMELPEIAEQKGIIRVAGLVS